MTHPETQESKFVRVMKHFSEALLEADAATGRLPPARAAMIHSLVDLGVAARMARIMSAEGVKIGMREALRELVVLIPALGRRAVEMKPARQASENQSGPTIPSTPTPEEQAVFDAAKSIHSVAIYTRTMLLEIVDSIYPR